MAIDKHVHDDTETAIRPGTPLWTANDGSWSTTRPDHMGTGGWRSRQFLFPTPVSFVLLAGDDPGLHG